MISLFKLFFLGWVVRIIATIMGGWYPGPARLRKPFSTSNSSEMFDGKRVVQ